MSNLESSTHEQGMAISRQYTKLQLWNSLAMLMSGILAYLFIWSMPIAVDNLAFSTAVATAFTVGVCCSPDSYRTRGGALTTAVCLTAFIWAIPLLLFVNALFG